VFELLKRTLKPEFLNRIDETIMFEPLTKEYVKEIVQLQFKHLQTRLKSKEINLTASEEVIDKLADIGFDPQFGARPIKRVIQKEVVNTLSKEILAGRVQKGQEIVLDEFDGKYVFRKPIEKDLIV
jgi:ATP-dependent Clp protease ATP-binding subunit ClpB